MLLDSSLAELVTFCQAARREGGLGGEIPQDHCIDLRTHLRTFLRTDLRTQGLVDGLQLIGHEGSQVALLVGLAEGVVVALLSGADSSG